MSQMASRVQGVEKTVEAQLQIGLGQVAIVSERFVDPIDFVGAGSEEHHLQLSLSPSPRNAVARFPEWWGPHRFERMGALFLLPAHRSLHARSDCRVHQSVVCRFDPERAPAWFGAELEWTDRRLTSSLDIANGDIGRVLYRIAEELRNPGFAAEVLIESLALQAGVDLSRFFHAIDGDGKAGGLPPWRMRLIRDALAHDSAGANLSSLARLCGLSVRHLTRSFRVTNGRSLHDYIAEHRIDRARRMLAAGMSVKEVAAASGFSAPTNFAAAFRRATGCTPRQYRQRAAH